MKKKVLNGKKGMILALAFFLASGAQCLVAAEGPTVKFAEVRYDFGAIKEGEAKTHVFVFQNTGDAPLVVKNVRTSCGCAAALVSDKNVAPGKKGEIKVTFNSRGYEGSVAKYIYFESNDKGQPVIQLQISAEVQVPPRPRIDLDRYTIDSGLILEGEPILAKATIINSGEQELVVTFSHRDAQYFTDGGKEATELRIAAGKRAEIEIEIPPRPKTGLLREYILLRSNDTRRPNLSLYVSGYVVTKKQLKELFEKYKSIIGSE
jgi:hypothetical protein